jgi:putative oxidoreductase
MTTTLMTRLTDPSTRAGLAEGGRDAVLLIARVGLGILMIWHAKVAYDYSGSVSGFVAGFEQIGIPLPELTARANLFGELVGGAALILGAGVRLVGLLMAVNMLGAWYWVHPHALYSFSLEKSGPESVIAIGLVSLLLVVTGAGRISLDHAGGGLRRRRRTAAPEPVPAADPVLNRA